MYSTPEESRLLMLGQLEAEKRTCRRGEEMLIEGGIVHHHGDYNGDMASYK